MKRDRIGGSRLVETGPNRDATGADPLQPPMGNPSPRAAGRITFYAGMAVILAAIVREHDQPTMAADIARCNGVTFKDLREGGADPFDLNALRGKIA